MSANPLLAGNTGMNVSPTAAANPNLYGSGGGINSQGTYSLLNSYGIAPRGKNTTAQMLQNTSAALYPELGQQIQYSTGLEGQRESAINDYINQMGPSGTAANVAAYGNGAQENAGTSARNAALEMGGQGEGSGAVGGATANMFNSAAGQTNAYNAQQNSPQARQQQLQGLLGGISAGQTSPALQQELSLYGPAQSTAQFNQQNQNQAFANSPLGQIGSLAGGALASSIGDGSFFPGMFSSGSGGSGMSYDDLSSYAPGGQNYGL